MKRWWLTVVLAVIVIALSLWLVFGQDEADRLVAAYGRDQTLGPRVVELGPDAIGPLCEALQRLPASDVSQADRQAMVNYVVALNAISGGWPYTTSRSMPVLLDLLQRMEDQEAKDLLVKTIGRSFKQLAVPSILDILEDEFRISKAGGPETLPSEAIVSELLKRLGPGRCLPVLAARLEMTTSDFRKTLVRLVCAFAPNQRVEGILARALEQERDPARRAYLTEMVEGLEKKENTADSAPPPDAP
jgi:hypothetical protein